MKKIFSLMLLFLVACSAELNVSESDSAANVPPEPPQLGVNEKEDCNQKTIGSKVCNFFLIDQNGEYWELYKHKGKIIILDFSTVWCYPCQMAAAHTQSIQDQYADDVVFVTLLIEGMDRFPATEDDVNMWVNSYGITSAPVLQASREYVMDQAGITGYLVGGYPTYVYLDRDLTINNAHTGFNEEYINSILNGLL